MQNPHHMVPSSSKASWTALKLHSGFHSSTMFHHWSIIVAEPFHDYITYKCFEARTLVCRATTNISCCNDQHDIWDTHCLGQPRGCPCGTQKASNGHHCQEWTCSPHCSCQSFDWGTPFCYISIVFSDSCTRFCLRLLVIAQLDVLHRNVFHTRTPPMHFIAVESQPTPPIRHKKIVGLGPPGCLEDHPKS